MSKDKNSKWNFVEIPSNMPLRSGEDSTFDHFRSKPYRFIVREFIQNSMDAAVDATWNVPVLVKISSGSIECEEYPQLIGALNERMKACQECCDENANSRNPYLNKVAYLQNISGKQLPYLVIADYNTTGMDYSNDKQCGFNAGVRQMGASHKGTGLAGGSHGLGKTVGFVASELNTVYYSTKTLDGSTFGEGVTRLCTHSINGKRYFSDAFYDSKNGEHPDKAMEIPDIFTRTEVGTSVFILGIQPKEQDIITMKQEVLRSFWLAIYHKKVIVFIDDEEFNEENLYVKMLQYLQEPEYNDYDVKYFYKLVERFNPKPYFFKCIKEADVADDNHIVFEAKSSKYPNLEHAMLYVYKDESIRNYTEDRIVCMRDKEMVVEFRRPGTRKGYYGVLICDGEGSKFLRKMENVTHDKWDKNEVKELDYETKKLSNLVLKEIENFITVSINSIFPTTDDTEYKVPVLSKYIVASGNRKNKEKGLSIDEASNTSNNPQLPISTVAEGITRRKIQPKKVGRVVIRRKGGAKKKRNKELIEGGLGMIAQPIEAPVTSINSPNEEPILSNGEPRNQEQLKNVNPESNLPELPKDTLDGHIGHENNGAGHYKKAKGGEHAEDIIADFRVIPYADDYGLVHRIIINSDASYKSCSMAITIAGEDHDTVLPFKPVNPNYRVTGKLLNILSDFDLVKGKNFIDVKFEDNDYHSLNLKAYEN